MKTFCASDFHLGHENANYPKINKFLKLVQNKGKHLIIVGDLLDLWVNDYDTIVNIEPMATSWKLLVETARKVSTIVIPGNHDFNLAELTDDLLVTEDFEQNNIYYTHGHKFDMEQCLGRAFYDEIEQELPHFYQKYLRTPFQTINFDQSELTRYIEFINESVELFAVLGSYDYVVYGHTHLPMLKGKLANCGDFIDSCSYIEIENGNPILHRI